MKQCTPQNSSEYPAWTGWVVLSLAVHIAFGMVLGARSGETPGKAEPAAIAVQLVTTGSFSEAVATPGTPTSAPVKCSGPTSRTPLPVEESVSASPASTLAVESVAATATPSEAPTEPLSGVSSGRGVADRSATLQSSMDSNASRSKDFKQAFPLENFNRPPEYPRVARQRGWEGDVMLWVRVDRLGRVSQSGVEASSGFALLDRSALRTVRGWRFQPAHHKGIPVESHVRVPISFRLERS